MQTTSGPVGLLDKNRPIKIIGAGISGLLVGYYLKKAGHSIEIFESNAKTGGKIQSSQTPYGPIESAANAIYTNDDVLELLEELNLKYKKSPEKLRKNVYIDGKISFKLLKWYQFIFIFFKLFKKCPPINRKTTVKDFFLPLLGGKFIDTVLSSALRGVYAQGAERLNFVSLFKDASEFQGSYFSFLIMLKKKRKASSPAMSISFEKGMQEFIDKLTLELKDNITFKHVKEVLNGDNTIICAPAFEAAQILKATHPDLATTLGEIDYTDVSSSTYILNRPIDQLDKSFGVLFPKSSNLKIMGILNNSAIFGRSSDQKKYSYTFITQATSNLFNTHIRETKEIGIEHFEESILLKKEHVWKKGIPIYDNKRLQAISTLRSQIYNYDKGLVLFGNYVDGISIREMVTLSKKLAQTI